MHTSLAPHLHTSECNKIIEAMLKCYSDHKFRKFFGYCDELDTQMRKCTKAERLERERLMRIASKEKHEQNSADFKKIEEKGDWREQLREKINEQNAS